MYLNRLSSSLTLSILIMLFSAGAIHASQDTTDRPPAALTDIKVLFKLDQRLTRSMYMGDRWVSPPTYTKVRDGENLVVEARAHGLDMRGNKVDINPEWKAADPSMITVLPDTGPQVTLILFKEGQSDVTVAVGDISRKLSVKATQQGEALSVEITQQALEGRVTETEPWSDKEKLSYSLGFDIGRKMREQSLDVDPDIYEQAFREALAGGEAAMSDQEMYKAIQTLPAKMLAERKKETLEREREALTRHRELAKKNREEGEAFLVENASKEDVVTLPSGLQYKILDVGTGQQPSPTDTVKVHFRGAFIDGTEFTNSRERGEPATVGFDNVIKGWAEALPLMKEGARWMIYVPANLAYGSLGVKSTGIGPSQVLIFEFELISIQ